MNHKPRQKSKKTKKYNRRSDNSIYSKRIQLDNDGQLLLGLEDRDIVGQGVFGAVLAGGVLVEHNLDLDAEHALSEHDVAHGRVDKVAHRLARVDHETVGKLHGLGTGSAQLARHNNLAACERVRRLESKERRTLGARLHNESDNAVAGTTDRQALQQLELDGFGLGNGAETALLDALGKQLNTVGLEVESALDERRELSDSSALFAEHRLRAGGADNDFRACGRHSHLEARIAVLGQLAGEELVQLGKEDSVSDKLVGLIE